MENKKFKSQLSPILAQSGGAFGEIFGSPNEIQFQRSDATLLIEYMELVEPMKIIKAPNHLLETKTYAKVGQNDLVHAKPSAIHFVGFDVGEKHVKSLKLLNASSDVQRMHIIPPQTQNFNIKYTKPEKMVPGMSLECVVEFTPDEWRYYYDCVRIHCQGEDNLVIPIHAYPVMSTKDFPRNYTFQPVPVGHSVSKTFPLKSMVPVDFEFNFNYIQSHPAFSIEPLSGIVPANRNTEVTVTFSPFEFQTARMTVELTISQFNLKGIRCTFTGSSQPGLLKEKTLLTRESEVLDPKFVSPLGRARTNKQRTKAVKSEGQNKTSSGPGQMITLEKEGIHFPAALDNPHAVNKVLLQEPGKLKASEMRQSMLTTNVMAKDATKQIKEAIFEQAVRQNVHEERQNQLRWQMKIGDDPLSAQERYKILENRCELMNHYKLVRKGDPVEEDELGRLETLSTYSRTMRNVDELAPEDAQFDIYLNNMWDVRYAALERFVQAARTVIIRNRADKRLSGLKNLKDFKQKEESGFFDGDSQGRSEKTETIESGNDMPVFTADRVQKYKFPTYVNPIVKDDMAPDALGLVPVTQTQIVVKSNVPFFDLKVPQHYRTHGYAKHSTSIGYIPSGHIRGLRTGAEDELIKIRDDEFSPCPVSAKTGKDKGALASGSGKRDATPLSAQTQHMSLTIPNALLRPIDYPGLQIMNPAPGLQVFLPSLPYSEVDYDYHLCPLPRYPRTDQTKNNDAVTQKRFLDREDTIKGVMNWKKFPSQGLVSLSNIPTLTSVWVPRWDDSFSKDLLPVDVPPLLKKLPADDAENCMENIEENNTSCLRPEMVTAQFPLIDTSARPEVEKIAGDDGTLSIPECDMFPHGNRMPKTNAPVGMFGPVAREKKEEELEYFVTNKYNRLGAKVAGKIAELDAKITDDNLVLKS